MKRSLFLTMCALLAGVGSAAATPINGSATGLSSPDSTITFDEHVLASNSSVTNEYSDLGVTFSPNVYYDPQEGFGLSGKTIGNFTFPTQPAFVDPMTMSFGGTRSGVAFMMAADTTPYTFTALLGGVAQESFTATVPGSALFYGFEGITFDQLMIASAGTGGGPYWLIDNIQQTGGSAVPEPASLVLLGSGLFMAARRRWTA